MTRAKVLIAIISGNRPALSERPTTRVLTDIADFGFTDIEWVVREDQAQTYEQNEWPVNTYSAEFAFEYARSHWWHPLAVCEPGGFFGAFPGREWAMREGERRGYDAVIQLDDNILTISPINADRHYGRKCHGQMFHLLTEIGMSTNVSMLGMRLNSVQANPVGKFVRVGFPYSIFMEKVGPGRLPYYGPFEDDIMHAMEYGLNGGPSRTSALLPGFAYKKDFRRKDNGMRKHYDTTRGLELARRYPRNARILESSASTSPVDKNRSVRHLLNTRGFTPIRVTDRPRFLQAQQEGLDLIETYRAWIAQKAQERIQKRAQQQQQQDDPVDA